MAEPAVTSVLMGSEVILRIRCASDYEAIALHDSICAAAAKTGGFNLRIDGAEIKQGAHRGTARDHKRSGECAPPE